MKKLFLTFLLLAGLSINVTSCNPDENVEIQTELSVDPPPSQEEEEDPDTN
jgi:hypothetical protein